MRLRAQDAAGRASGQCRPLRTLTLPRRELRFPSDHSVGTVYLRGPGQGGIGAGQRRWVPGWRQAGEARGRIVVPAGTQLKLRLRTEGLPDTDVLLGLRAGDLQALSLEAPGTSWDTSFWTPASVLASVSHLEGLELLELWSAPVGDEAMQFISRLSRLRVLDLWGTRVSDAGLAALTSLTGLRRLTVPGRQTGDAGMPCLADLASLRELDLSGSSVTDAGIAYIAGAGSLVRLSLWGTQVTDAGLRHLYRLASLADLDLGATAVTDQGLAYLRRLPLRRLSLRDTLVSPEGIRGLRLALGGCFLEPGDGPGTCEGWRPPTFRRREATTPRRAS